MMRMPIDAAMRASCGERYIFALSTQKIERRIESLAGIKLRVRDEPAGIVERGVEEHLHASSSRALNPGTEQHVGLPDLIANLRFELLMRGARCLRKQLLF